LAAGPCTNPRPLAGLSGGAAGLLRNKRDARKSDGGQRKSRGKERIRKMRNREGEGKKEGEGTSS